VKKNVIRLAKLEDKLVGNRSDLFRLSDFEILERIEEIEFRGGRKPTQKFLDMRKVADKTMPMFTPKVYQRMKEEQAERHVQIETMNEVELDDHLDKLIIESDMEGVFEDACDNEKLKNYKNSKKETLV
jgi:hypothetical protein